MLIQALAEYADTRLQDQLNDLAFETKRVPYFLEIGRDGTFLNLVERTEQVQRGKKTVKQVSNPAEAQVAGEPKQSEQTAP